MRRISEGDSEAPGHKARRGRPASSRPRFASCFRRKKGILSKGRFVQRGGRATVLRYLFVLGKRSIGVRLEHGRRLPGTRICRNCPWTAWHGACPLSGERKIEYDQQPENSRRRSHPGGLSAARCRASAGSTATTGASRRRTASTTAARAWAAGSCAGHGWITNHCNRSGAEL